MCEREGEGEKERVTTLLLIVAYVCVLHVGKCDALCNEWLHREGPHLC